ncbi:MULTISPECIES: ABC transporter permease [unclassified Chelatococcus]|uniref:ABC transporter permease n=1 Tax=unclassified Chelatococcus TaxID=2638111 RepID=UPI001BD07173|nr:MULTISPECIES: ABC transporter permease [unclassified Chelatococcus]MBS7701082.1 ABC transporter permease [Chelatococcus sp. YT9]MBX3555615.1 ABC transporter permease [Chelatococcus sp.]
MANRKFPTLAIMTAVGLVLVWEGGVRALDVPAYLLPSPSLIIRSMVTNWAHVADNAIPTTVNMVGGFLLSAAVGVPLAMALAYSALFERAVYPIVVFLQIVPKIAIAPLFIIWFGFGTMPKLLLVFLLTFFPIIVNAVVGFKTVDPGIMEFARATGARGLRTFMRIQFPSALPSIFTGLKVAAALASTAAVVAEFVSSDNGLGYLIITYNGQLMTAMVFATILVLGVIGLAFYYLIEILEKIVLPWHVARLSHGT